MAIIVIDSNGVEYSGDVLMFDDTVTIVNVGDGVVRVTRRCGGGSYSGSGSGDGGGGE